MNLTPRVSVLMSVYNAEQYLSEAVESVLAQTFRDFEFLIINDGSGDGSVDILESFDDPRIRIEHNDANLGLVRSLNRGLKLAQGELIARFDADDICMPERLAEQVALLDAEPALCLVGSALTLIDANGVEQGQWLYPETHHEIAWFLLFNSAVAHPSAMYRAELVRSIGGYSLDFRLGEDYELWSRVAQAGRSANIPRALVRYRIHSGGVSRQRRAEQQAVQLKIASANARRYYECPELPATLKRVLESAQPVNYEQLLSDHAELLALAEQFSRAEQLSSEQSLSIKRDIQQRIRPMLAQLPRTQRLRCLLTRPSLAPTVDWVNGRSAALLLRA